MVTIVKYPEKKKKADKEWVPIRTAFNWNEVYWVKLLLIKHK